MMTLLKPALWVHQEMRNIQPKLSPSMANGHSSRRERGRVREQGVGMLEFLLCRLKEQWRSYRKQLRKCRRNVSEDAVHDLRVEARRLISLLDLMSSFVPASCVTRAHEELKCHLDTFDDLRDTQVQLSATRKLRKDFPAARHFHRFLKKREADLCKIAAKDSTDLQIKPVGKPIKTIRDCAKRWLLRHSRQQANLLLTRSITRAFERVRQLKKRIDPNDTHSIHCTRIAFKKFRYMLEALDRRAVALSKELLERLRHYQGLMGDIQDAEVLLRAFEKFVRKEKPEVRPALQLTEALLGRRRKLIGKYLAGADELTKFWPAVPTARAIHPGNSRNNKKPKTKPRSSGARGLAPLRKTL